LSSAPGPERPLARADWRQMLAIGVIVSALGIAAGLLIDWFPLAASKQAKPIDTLWDVLIIFSVPVFVLVETVVLFSVWKFRMRPGEELLDGPPIHGNTRLEIIWTAIPAILLVGLCTYAFLVLRDIEKADAGQPVKVRVVGQQFAWTFHYPGPGGKDLMSPQLYVPIGKQVEFTLQSKDVIHDFWVPEFRVKRDAVPGIDTHYRVTPTRIGTYPVICNELCGLGHATMRANAHVLSQKDYDAWVKKLAAGPAKPAPSAPAANGKALFTSSSCNACHKLADAGSTGTVGPDLDTALRGKDPAFIKTSIVDPNAQIAPGYQPNIMPDNFAQQLTPAQIDALVKYLSDVTKGG
jgi:cytochrome c oxidase subunit II